MTGLGDFFLTIIHVSQKFQEGCMVPGFDELYLRATSALNPRRLSQFAEAGGVGAAILAANGEIYTGVCIDTSSGMGFCAEHAAAAAMVTAGESQVIKMVAVDWDGRILPPCGRCREFISQLHDQNPDAEVLVAEGLTQTLRELLPYDWKF
jgi:cytidine deaminase